MTDPELRKSFRGLAERAAAVPLPAHLESAVMAEFDRTYGARPKRWRYAALAGALAASIAAGMILVRPQPKPDVHASEPPAFMPIPYTPPIEPYERVTVVQTDVPVRALLAAGFRVQTSDPGGSVRADVMVSQDGRPRAIRPVVFQAADRSMR